MVYTVGPQVDPGGFIRSLTEQLSAMGLGAYAANHEYMNSQYEINLHHGEAVDAADRAFRLKAAVKDVAAINGLVATFMGKPFNDQGGSGLHLHVSLDKDGSNAFDDADGDNGISTAMRHFLGGVMAHAPALMAILNPTINAFRRLVPDSLAPTHANWGWDNRGAFGRVPPERGPATRLEIRVGDGAANPYLAIAPVARGGARRARGRRRPHRRDRPGDRHAVPGDEALRDRAPPGLRVRVGAHRVPPPPLRAMTDTTSTLDAIDLSDHDAFVDHVPHEWFAELRRNDPVHWNPERDGGRGFWAVTRYDDIRTVHRDVETYSSELGGTSLEDLDDEQIKARKSMLDMDPPRHDELRGLIARRFTPRAVHVWEDQVRTVVNRVLDTALPRSEMDFVHEISSEIPMQIFAEILGVPQEERREIIEIGDRLLGNQDPEFAVTETADEHRNLPFSHPAALEMFEFGRRLAADRRKHPGNDIITQLAFEPLTQQEFDTYFVLLATAGNETTRHTITHGLLALLEFPEEMERLRSDAELGKTAAEEMLRWATPVHHFRRTAAVDSELAGTQIKAGDKVTTWFVSGNFDESVFEDPHRFDIGRTPNRHMAFGPGGIHHCMGAHLAKMEIRITFEELLKRSADIELLGPPERLRSNFFNGIKRLPVRVTQ
jgi:cytochrome P450